MSTSDQVRHPRTTYRLQISASFTVDDAVQVLPYLRSLGVDWLYLSPILGAEPGSDHGYDVVDPTTVDAIRGGEAGLRRLAEAMHQAGGGVLVDVVPNHLGVATARNNPWWWDVLTHGPQSAYAEYFDIDWDAGDGKLLIPVLGDGTAQDPEAELENLHVVNTTLGYYDNVYPIAPGTDHDDASAQHLHRRQHYRLVPWRWADQHLNYRRFFAVNELAGVRIEDPDVFEATHGLILRLIDDGVIDGLRLDHTDGLADPTGYFARLRQHTHGAYTLTEKILEPGEQYPAAWAIEGTTGYDALAELERVLIDPGGAAALAEAGDTVDWQQLVHHTKRWVADGMLGSEVNRLVRNLDLPGFGAFELTDAMAELLACFPVYRSYLPAGSEHLDEAVTNALTHRPDLTPVIEAVAQRLADPDHPAAVRFQQTSGMVMAKGVEDTAFYRYSLLSSLNEVGGDPSWFSLDVEDFHAAMSRRQASTPSAMTTLSTHDTKRNEDVRARIDVLAEIPDFWADQLQALRETTELGEPAFEKLLWESILGAWPTDGTAPEIERIRDYALKAAREAGTSTTWTAQNQQFEQTLSSLAEQVCAIDTRARQLIETVNDRIASPGASNQLSLKFLQLCAPGVPDVYQGTEIVFPTLVDPDNRRAVDFQARAELLQTIDAAPSAVLTELQLPRDVDRAKLLVTSRVLRARRDHPEWFGTYTPAEVIGERADHLIAAHRGTAVTVATRWPLGLADAGGWGQTRVLLPQNNLIDVLTGQRVDARTRHGAVPVRHILTKLPVALLVPAEELDYD